MNPRMVVLPGSLGAKWKRQDVGGRLTGLHYHADGTTLKTLHAARQSRKQLGKVKPEKNLQDNQAYNLKTDLLNCRWIRNLMAWIRSHLLKAG